MILSNNTVTLYFNPNDTWIFLSFSLICVIGAICGSCNNENLFTSINSCPGFYIVLLLIYVLF